MNTDVLLPGRIIKENVFGVDKSSCQNMKIKRIVVNNVAMTTLEVKMAQFYGDIQGNRGQATRMGTKKAGMDGHIRGWHIGARVWMRYNEQTKEDECTIDLTSGSSPGRGAKRLGTFTAKDLES